MNILSWNCRGVGRSRTVQELVRLVQTYNPKIVFLSETRQCDERVRNLKWRLGLRNCLTAKGVGKGGGLGLFGDENLDVELLSIGENHVDVLVKEQDKDLKWRGTFVYGEPRVQDRHLMWERLRTLKNKSSAPWVMIGDFNEAMWSFEYFSQTRRREKQMKDFRDVLSPCDLHDLGFSGVPWTYNNKQEGERNVRVRLDRAVASPSWSDLFSDAQVVHLMSSRSDHCPILLKAEVATREKGSKRCFRYEIMWERMDSLPEVIKQTWDCRPIICWNYPVNSSQ